MVLVVACSSSGITGNVGVVAAYIAHWPYDTTCSRKSFITGYDTREFVMEQTNVNKHQQR
eukprot:17060-Heterococcus_DN1.PRE.2